MPTTKVIIAIQMEPADKEILAQMGVKRGLQLATYIRTILLDWIKDHKNEGH